jgi:guanylate kinase
MQIKGNLFIISAPSGAGKTSLVKQLVETTDNLYVSVSHTTRNQRPGETNGTDYYFVSPNDFNDLIKKDELLEYACVFDNFYGTSKKTVDTIINRGADVILEIDWQGARQIKQTIPSTVTIFILPPSTEILEKRLRDRGQDDDEVIARRMRDAVAEMSHYHEYDFIVVNDNFETALSDVKSILVSQRLTKQQQIIKLSKLIKNLLGNN